MERRTSHHPNVYTVKDSNDYEVSVDYNHFEKLSQKFANLETTKPYRSGQCSWGDGRRFTTVWRGNPATYTPCITGHRYENRVARSHSILNFRDVDPKKYGLYKYPEIYDYHSQNSILGWDDPTAERILTKANCEMGAIKQVRIFIVVFKDKPIDAGIEQQMIWKNGNKNEVVVTIGISSDNLIQWVYPFCWGNEQLKVDLREDLAELPKFDIRQVVDKTIKLVNLKFSRKAFSAYKYITLEPPLWAVILCLCFICLLNGGIGYWIVANDID
jgi:hypothetical protein